MVALNQNSHYKIASFTPHFLTSNSSKSSSNNLPTHTRVCSKMDHSLETSRHKCAACFRQFNKIEHLVDHMRTSFHSVHEPTCAICKKHCRSLDSLREHLIGPLPKQECKNIFATRGCKFCLAMFDTSYSQRIHQERCQLSGVNSGLLARFANMGIRDGSSNVDNGRARGSGAVALACKYVGGGSDGSVDICAKVCLIDESENVIFHSYIKPIIPVTNYRYETTGIRPEHFREAMMLKQCQKKIQDILYNGGEKARVLVGHSVEDDLKRLQIGYPSVMLRDTANYPPLMKTSKLCNSLKYLAQVYLGFEIQNGIQDAYEECVAGMRLYKRMRSQVHRKENHPMASDPQNKNNFAVWKENELQNMAPHQMLDISRSDYYCWCMDSII